MAKPPEIIRAYPVASSANAGKLAMIRGLYAVYKSEFADLAKLRFHRFLAGDGKALVYKGSTKGAVTQLSQAQYQGLLARVCEALNSHVGHLKTRTLKLLKHSSVKHSVLQGEVRFLCKTGQWVNCKATQTPKTLFVPDDSGAEIEVANIHAKRLPVSKEAFALAKCLLRRARREIRFPDVKRPKMLLDSRTGTLEESKGKAFSHWLYVSTLTKGKRVAVPLNVHNYAQEAAGRYAQSMELAFKEGKLQITLFKKSTVEEQQAVFIEDEKPCLDETLALDWGMTTLIATSNGELLGRDWLKRITAYDQKLTDLAKQRQKLGLKTRSKRYDELRWRIVGFVKTEIGRVLNRLISRYPKLKTLTVESLHLFDKSLSKRMNRLLRTVGFGLFKTKLKELATIRNFEVVEVNPAYSSQECPHCGFVHAQNRKTQAVFRCLLCGKAGHADAIAAQNLKGRSLRGLIVGLAKEKTLSVLYRRFTAFLDGAGHRWHQRYQALLAGGIAFGARRALPPVAKASGGSSIGQLSGDLNLCGAAA